MLTANWASGAGSQGTVISRAHHHVLAGVGAWKYFNQLKFTHTVKPAISWFLLIADGQQDQRLGSVFDPAVQDAVDKLVAVIRRRMQL